MRWSRFSNQKMKALSLDQPLRLKSRAAFLSLAALLMALPAQAKITIGDIAEATVSNREDLDKETPVVYGGVAGSNSAGTCSAPSTEIYCDNCIDSGLAGDNNLQACNNRRIHPGLFVRITFSSDTVDNGKVRITTNKNSTEGAGPTILNVDTSRTPTILAKGSSGTIYVPWSQICDAAAADSQTTHTNCVPALGSMKTTLRIGVSGDTDDFLESTTDDFKRINFIIQKDIGQQGGGEAGVSLAEPCSDANAKGICSFEIGSGDAKAIVKHIRAINGFPNTSGIQFRWVRFYYESAGAGTDPTTFQRITPASPHEDLAVSGTNETNQSVSPSKVSAGIENGNAYYFKTAVVDAARNVGYFTSSTGDTYCQEATDPAGTDCHLAVPGEVVGAVSKDMNCFIATAAFGSRLDPQVETFRKFRDRVLLKTNWGKSFVSYYYKHSPRYAQMISESEALRAVTRSLLWPLLAFSWLSLQIGATAALLLVATLVLLSVLVIRTTGRSRSAERSTRA